MTTRWLCILVAMLCRLPFATSASAECAWVLWHNPGPDTYSISNAFSSASECDALLQATEMRYPSEGYETRAGTHLLAVTNDKKRTLTNEDRRWRIYLCLPDTVDPSGPKAK